MNDLPDAPWIREAEQFGVPEGPVPTCPCCGEECDNYFTDGSGDIIGCENCVRKVDAYDYHINE